MLRERVDLGLKGGGEEGGRDTLSFGGGGTMRIAGEGVGSGGGGIGVGLERSGIGTLAI